MQGPDEVWARAVLRIQKRGTVQGELMEWDKIARIGAEKVLFLLEKLRQLGGADDATDARKVERERDVAVLRLKNVIAYAERMIEGWGESADGEPPPSPTGPVQHAVAELRQVIALARGDEG